MAIIISMKKEICSRILKLSIMDGGSKVLGIVRLDCASRLKRRDNEKEDD